MQKVYKSRIYRILVNLVFGIAAAGVSFLIASIWLDVIWWAGYFG